MKTISLYSQIFAVLTLFFASQCAKNPADDVDSAEIRAIEESAKLLKSSNAPLPMHGVELSASSSQSEVAANSAGSAKESLHSGLYRFSGDSGSSISFIGSKVTGSHQGGFKNFSGSFSVDEGKLSEEGVHSVRIFIGSLFSDSKKLTGHLLGKDFLDAQSYPFAEFILDEVEGVDGEKDRYRLSGTLQLHGVTKAIEFPATVLINREGIRLNSEFSIDRTDFGITYPGMPDDLIRKEVILNLQIVADSADKQWVDSEAMDLDDTSVEPESSQLVDDTVSAESAEEASSDAESLSASTSAEELPSAEQEEAPKEISEDLEDVSKVENQVPLKEVPEKEASEKVTKDQAAPPAVESSTKKEQAVAVKEQPKPAPQKTTPQKKKPAVSQVAAKPKEKKEGFKMFRKGRFGLGGKKPNAALIKVYDRNGNGRIERRELPSKMWQLISKGDRNRDGVIAGKELQFFAK